MLQLALDFSEPPASGVVLTLAPGPDVDGLTCGLGYPWRDHLLPGAVCPGCQASLEEGCRAFDEAVARGEYDENGYTPAEAKAARRRGTYRAWTANKTISSI